MNTLGPCLFAAQVIRKRSSSIASRNKVSVTRSWIGKPFIKGRTEVEQLHKIFKLCVSPLEEFWSKSKLPHATMFKPQSAYESCLRERCKEFPCTALDLFETLLSIEPQKRGTASSALSSGYFAQSLTQVIHIACLHIRLAKKLM